MTAGDGNGEGDDIGERGSCCNYLLREQSKKRALRYDIWARCCIARKKDEMRTWTAYLCDHWDVRRYLLEMLNRINLSKKV